jgi:hypothetical protein
LEGSREQVSPWLPITRNEVLTHDNLDGDCNSPYPCENWCRNSAQSALWGRRKNDGFFTTLAGGKTAYFLKNANWVWGRNAPTSAGEQSAQIAFLYYRAKLASSKIARIQEGQK